jgi:23S rRNA (adenine2503-C2)-methyltransferase
MLHPEVPSSERLNVHFARMGEPTLNPNVLECARWLKTHIDPEYNVHPVVSTMLPRHNPWLKTFIHTWMRIKNRLYRGNAGLQLSINSTDEEQRSVMFQGRALSLLQIARLMEGIVPVGRKITLNFAVAGFRVDPNVLLQYFSPELYIVKLTPMHKTQAAERMQVRTEGDYTTPEPYIQLETDLRQAGYEVLVFIASHDEDAGRITCGNAILSGTLPHKYVEMSA